VSPIWIAMEDGNITFNTALGRLKERNIRRDPRVAISVANRDDFYYPWRKPGENRLKVVVEPVVVAR
jgi:hypothetical protein